MAEQKPPRNLLPILSVVLQLAILVIVLYIIVLYCVLKRHLFGLLLFLLIFLLLFVRGKVFPLSIACRRRGYPDSGIAFLPFGADGCN